MARSPQSGIRVFAPARLHLGFLDLHGAFGRKFGSIGLTLEWPCTLVEAVPSSRLGCQGLVRSRTCQIAKRFYTALAEKKHLPLQPAAHLAVKEVIPPHSGLGSGTQLALAIGQAVNQLHALALSIPEIALLLERGKRSGIGIGSFLKGGFLVDGGSPTAERIPPIICHHDFPEEWWVLLIVDPTQRGLYGAAEAAAFQNLLPFPSEEAALLCRHTLMQMLPALVERDIQTFGKAINSLQTSIGNYFAPVQGGRFTSPQVAAALQQVRQWGAPAVGQSSWGPTGFAFVEGEAAVRELHTQLTWWAQSSLSQERQKLKFIITRARNQGSCIESLATITPPIPL
jgi:beta-ribofuranosylaminobenzene 5'-phosphate synthase